jgi:flagellar biosynthesis anti-sigma factor FlgM
MVGPVTYRTQIPGTVHREPGERLRQPADKQAPVTAMLSPSRLAELARTLAESGPPVDHARIAQLRQAIAQGSYALNPDSIADALYRQLAI